MELSGRELWTVLHGMVFGAGFLLAFGGALAGLYSLRPDLVTPHGVRERLHRLRIGLWLVAAIDWFTVLSGTWIIYIWYRATAPVGADLAAYPQALLLSRESTRGWHEFGMEWKEHVAWISPMLATSAAFIVSYYGRRLYAVAAIRRAVMVLMILAFGTAAVAGVMGAFINKVAATR